MAKVRMVQTNLHNWRIESLTGIIVKDDISVQNPYKAEEFVKSYISSFQSWTYEMVPLPKEKKK
jgi:hypothetical protein